MHDKMAILEKQIDRQEQYPRCNCNLLHDIPESKGEATDDVTVKTTCENINGNINTANNIDGSQMIVKYDPQKKNPRTAIMNFAKNNVQDRVFQTNVSQKENR